MKALFVCFALLLLPGLVIAQCPDTEVSILSTTVAYGSEMSWELFDEAGVLVGSFQGEADNTVANTTLCLANGCYRLDAADSYGDGWNGGSVTISFAGEVLTYGLPAGAGQAYFFGINQTGCTPFVPGCTDAASLNYEPAATVDDGSCVTLAEVIAVQTFDTIHYGGPKDNRINWVIQNRGSSFTDRQEFVQLFQDDLLRSFVLGDAQEVPPYAQYRDFFNLYAAWWPAAPDDDTWWSFPIIQQMRDAIFLPWANAETGWATWFSSTKFGGGGGAGLNREARVGDGKMYGMGYETFIHEFGHTMPGLPDEYSSSGVWSNGQCWESGNTTGFTTKDDIPWRLWIEDDTPLPTPYTAEYLDKIGAFEGALTNFFGCHRPTARGCIMGAGGFGEGYGDKLCAVCQQRTLCFIYKYVNVIENPMPSQPAVQVSGAETVHFSAEVLKPDPNTQQYEWFLNGRLIAEGVEAVDVTFGPCDTYELTFAVTDTNTLVRYDPKFADIYPRPYREFTWTINQTEVADYALHTAVSVQEPDCSGVPNGSVSFTLAEGQAPFKVHYAGEEVANPVTGLAAGTYEYSIVDANGCGFVQEVTLAAAPRLAPRICSASSAGAWTLTVEDAHHVADDLTYLWSTGDQTATVADLPVGTYTVTVTTASGCSVSTDITLQEATSELTVDALVLASELERNSGKIVLDIAGGVAPYTISWQEKLNRDITDTATDNIGASGTTWGHLPAYAFDNDLSTKWLHFVSQDAWIQYSVPGGAVVNYYTITSGDDVPGRDPKDWLLQGSLDGNSWTTLDEQTGQSFSGRRQKRAYPLTNEVAYSHYRFYVLANHGDGSIQLQQLEFIGTKNTDVFMPNDDVADQAQRSELAPGAYLYTIKDANGTVLTDTLLVGYAAAFLAEGLKVVQHDDCSVRIDDPDAAYTYYWLADEAGNDVLHIGTTFQPPASGNYYVGAVDPMTQAMSTNRKGFAVTLDAAPLVEVTTDNALAVVDPDPALAYRWYAEATCQNLLHVGATYSPDQGSGVYYVAATNTVPRPEPIDPLDLSGLIVRMDAADLDGDGVLDDPVPASSSLYGWEFTNGNSWEDNSWFAYRGNYQNGLGVADFATIWLQGIEQAETGYQTILLAYEENPISFPETAPFNGLSQDIPRHSDASQLFSDNAPATTLNGSTYLNGISVDPLTTPNPLEFCILGVQLTQPSNAQITRTDTRWEGKLGEMLLWDYALSESDIQGVSEYLRRKWISTADLESPKVGIYWESPVGTTPVPTNGISFYPNPTSHSIQIEGLRGGERGQIIGVNGSVQHTFFAHSSTLAIDLSNLPTGLYLLLVVDASGKQVVREKLVKL